MKILIYDSGYGVIPFIKYAITHRKLHSYYLYLDEEVFPLGKKSESFILTHLTTLLSKFKNEQYDLIIFACNTMGAMLEKLDTTQLGIDTLSIFQINKSLITNNTLFLGTKISIANLDCKTLDGSELPELIESHKFQQLISHVKALKVDEPIVILGCTHFPLIVDVFKRLHPKSIFIDGHAILMEKICEGHELSLDGTAKGLKIISEFFPNCSHKKTT